MTILPILPILLFCLGSRPIHAAPLESAFERPADPTLVQALGTLSSFIESPDGELTPDLLNSYCFLRLNALPKPEQQGSEESRMLTALGRVLKERNWTVAPRAALQDRESMAVAQKVMILHKLRKALLILDPQFKTSLDQCQRNIRPLRQNTFLRASLETPLNEALQQQLSRRRVVTLAQDMPWVQDETPALIFPVRTEDMILRLPSNLQAYRDTPGRRLAINRALQAAGVELPAEYRDLETAALPPLTSLSFTHPRHADLLNILRDRAEKGTLGELFEALNLAGRLILRVSGGLPAIELFNPASTADTRATLDWGMPRGRVSFRRHDPVDMKLASFLQYPVLEEFAVPRLTSLLPGIASLLKSDLPPWISPSEEAYLWLLALGYDVDFAAGDHGFFRPADEERLWASFRREVLADRPSHFPLPKGAEPSDQAIEAAWRAYRKAAAALTALLRQENGPLKLNAPAPAASAMRGSRNTALPEFEGARIRDEIHSAVLHTRDALGMSYSATGNEWTVPPASAHPAPSFVRPARGAAPRPHAPSARQPAT